MESPSALGDEFRASGAPVPQMEMWSNWGNRHIKDRVFLDRVLPRKSLPRSMPGVSKVYQKCSVARSCNNVGNQKVEEAEDFAELLMSGSTHAYLTCRDVDIPCCHQGTHKCHVYMADTI